MRRRLERALRADLHHFPTRRSSDLGRSELNDAPYIDRDAVWELKREALWEIFESGEPPEEFASAPRRRDRKSTRLNSSHMSISYAVFCLKKKKRSELRRHGRPIPPR